MHVAGTMHWDTAMTKKKKKKKESNNIKSRSFRINILVGKTCGHKTNKEKAEYSQ